MERKRIKPGITSPAKDLITLIFAAAFIFTLSYFFNVFGFLMYFFKDNPKAITWVDEIITALLTLSVGFAIFSWRRWVELKRETAERIRLQEELLNIAETKAETERIICKELHCDIEEYKKVEKNISSRRHKAK
jgi:predicted nucleic acid-binding protein